MYIKVLKELLTMRNVYIVEKHEIIHNRLYFSLNDNEAKIQIEPANQILVDSDSVAFIYLVEEGDGYSYIRFPQTVWSGLVQLCKEQKNPYLSLGDREIELYDFVDELQMLLLNIEGNDNYGSHFVEQVEEVFKEFLSSSSREV